MTREEFENTHCYMCSSIACDRTDECVEACGVYQKEVLGKEEFTLESLLDDKLTPLQELQLDLMRAWIGAPQHDQNLYNDTIEHMAKYLLKKEYSKPQKAKWIQKRTFTTVDGVIRGIYECSCCGRNETVAIYDKRNIEVCGVFDKHCRKCGALMEVTDAEKEIKENRSSV